MVASQFRLRFLKEPIVGNAKLRGTPSQTWRRQRRRQLKRRQRTGCSYGMGGNRPIYCVARIRKTKLVRQAVSNGVGIAGQKVVIAGICVSKISGKRGHTI